MYVYVVVKTIYNDKKLKKRLVVLTHLPISRNTCMQKLPLRGFAVPKFCIEIAKKKKKKKTTCSTELTHMHVCLEYCRKTRGYLLI